MLPLRPDPIRSPRRLGRGGREVSLDLVRELQDEASRRSRFINPVLCALLRRAADRITELERRLSDVARYDESGRRYANEQIRALDGAIPVLKLLRRDPYSDGWRLRNIELEANNLPTPEQLLRALAKARPSRP
jgi:hypothetical protein